MSEEHEEYIINEISARLERQSKEVVTRNALFDALREWREWRRNYPEAAGCDCLQCKLTNAYDDWAATQ